MNLRIVYSRQAEKFIEKNPSALDEETADRLVVSAVRKILKIEDTSLDLKKLKADLKNHFRIRHGRIRIVFSLSGKDILVAFVSSIDTRDKVYR
ncbi:MAG: hypothetical protein PHQ23_15690 [Candidatus Wallbacteria bacterium]|nr:hypothetical protein [Candidatus Wallbacteria bacterium]